MTDGFPFYQRAIPPGKHYATKRQTFTVEGYNSNVRHFLARLHRKTKCYSKSIEMLRLSVRLFIAKWNGTMSALF
jgi:insertion element IS1 protein InsB